VYADLTSSSGLTAGLGQPVNVAGVRVGQVAGVELRNGVARLELEVDPAKLPRVYEDATAALIPNTPLKDLLLELGPGGPPAKPLRDGGVIPVAATSPPIDSDELTSALDADTRDFLQLLVHDADRATRGRGQDLNELLEALGPTARQLREVTGALAARRTELRRLVGNLRRISEAVAGKDAELVRVVEQANATLETVNEVEGPLGASLDRLPGTLSTVRSSLDDVAGFADELVPTLQRLRPAVRVLPGALRDLDPLLTDAEPVLRTKLRPLVRDLTPLARDLGPATAQLNAVTPDLIQAFLVLNYVVNETAYNPPGDNEGFLFWTAWFAHNAASVLSTEDRHGAVFRGLILTQCEQLAGAPEAGSLYEVLFGSLSACEAGG
jgi:phospholipid/cholesterol/gamma-HCH transport system substrate-binding protein